MDQASSTPIQVFISSFNVTFQAGVRCCALSRFLVLVHLRTQESGTSFEPLRFGELLSELPENDKSQTCPWAHHRSSLHRPNKHSHDIPWKCSGCMLTCNKANRTYRCRSRSRIMKGGEALVQRFREDIRLRYPQRYPTP